MKKYIWTAAVAGLVVSGAAQAADLYKGGYKDNPVVAESWTNPGDIFVRVRGLAVLPQTGTSDWRNVAATSDLSISDTGIPEIDFTYFFTKNIAAELIAGVTPHTISAAGSLLPLKQIGSTTLLPPTLTLQYHFNLTPQIKPYVGAGVNYTFFLDERNHRPFSSFNVDNTFGAALQAGFDYKLAGNWFLNVDFKYLFLETDAHVVTGGARIDTHVNIDPIIVGAGIGYRFGSSYVPLK
jgi:outer membrane protein